ncbi:MAG: tandem-95 repeat protein [Caldiserica bacterium]|nr:tandem-95 repeat protein [Caldisericota bacterium]
MTSGTAVKGLSSGKTILGLLIMLLCSASLAAPAMAYTAPSVTTNAPTTIGATSATLNGNLTSKGGYGAGKVDVWFRWRVLGSATWNATTVRSGVSTGVYSFALSGLSANTTYEFRAVAYGAYGSDFATGYGTIREFTTANTTPVISEGADTSVAVDEDGSPTSWSLTLHATDADGDTMTWSISTPASHGTATTAIGTGTSNIITYAPTTDYNGLDSFVVQVSDGHIGADDITVNVTVSPRNDTPVNTVFPSIWGTMNVGNTLTGDLGEWNDDIDANVSGDPFSPTYMYRWVRADDASGTNAADITSATSSVYVLSNEDAHKYLRARITCTDDGVGLPATKSVTLLTSWTTQVVNRLPVISEGTSTLVTMDEDGCSTAFSLTLTATDVDNDTLTWNVLTQALHGTATASGMGLGKAIGYTPAINYNGSDSFAVQVNDGYLGTDTITVNVTVIPVNDMPANTTPPAISGISHVGRTLTTTSGGWNDAIDTDVSGTSMLSYEYQWLRSIDGGATFVDIPGATGPTYMLTLADNLQLVLSKVTCTDDGVGVPLHQSAFALSAPVPVAILNAAPVITEGPAVSTSCDEDESPVALMLVLHATDPDAIDTLTWQPVTLPAHGSLTLPAPSVGSSTASWVYHPALNWNGTDTFTLRVEDGLTGSAIITVSITVNPRNDAPVNTVGPGIAGSLFVNHEVCAMIGSWNDVIDTDVSGMSVLSYTHQWLRARDAEGTGLALISGAIVSSYVVSPMDEGMYLAVRVTCTDGGVGLPASVSTSADSAFLPARYLDTMPPTIELPDFSSWPGVTSCSGDTTPSFTVTDASFALRFTVGDDCLGGVQLSISVGGRALSTAQCTDSSARALPLVEGPNDVQITAVDAAGNMSARHLSITLDTHAPAVTLATRPPLTTTSSVLTITGSVRDNFSSVRSLSVNGVPVIPYVDGTFRCELSLKKGENTVQIAAADSAGNSGSETYDVTYTPASPSPVSGHTIVLTIGSKTMTLDGARIALDTRTALVDDRTLLPLRAVVQHLGGSIAWNARTRQVTLKVRGTTIVLTIGKNSALVNGKPLAIDAKNSKVVPLISSGCTMLPLRFVAENLGLKVGWNAKTKAVTLTWDD